MNDFKTDIQYNIQLLKSQLRIDSNFDILYRNVIIGEQEAGFFFIKDRSTLDWKFKKIWLKS